MGRLVDIYLFRAHGTSQWYSRMQLSESIPVDIVGETLQSPEFHDKVNEVISTRTWLLEKRWVSEAAVIPPIHSQAVAQKTGNMHGIQHVVPWQCMCMGNYAMTFYFRPEMESWSRSYPKHGLVPFWLERRTCLFSCHCVFVSFILTTNDAMPLAVWRMMTCSIKDVGTLPPFRSALA
jgi:hypothetical protein